MEWKYCVIEIEQRVSNLIIAFSEKNYKDRSVWNIIFTVPYNPIANDEVIAFDACMAWLEQNKVESSKYVITEMFFV